MPVDIDMGGEGDNVDGEEEQDEDDEEGPSQGDTMGGYEGPAVDAARARIIYW